MVRLYKGEDPSQAGLLQSDGQCLKFPYASGLHYEVTICEWLLIHGNHTRMVSSYKNLYAYGFKFQKPVSVWYLFAYGFPIPMPILVICPNHNSMGTNIS